MKVKCIQLLSAGGRNVEHSTWLTLGQVYHVMSIFIDGDGRRSYRIIIRHPEGEWPQLGSHRAECFEVMSNVVPSNWREVAHENVIDISPVAWQQSGFYEAFSDHDPATFAIYERERDTILREDP